MMTISSNHRPTTTLLNVLETKLKAAVSRFIPIQWTRTIRAREKVKDVLCCSVKDSGLDEVQQLNDIQRRAQARAVH